MMRDELVSGFGNRREPRNVIVTPRQPSLRRSISQRTIDGFRGKKRFAVRLNESHRALELFDWNFWKLIRCLLISGVIDFTGGDFSPALDPQPAEITFPVPDQERFRRKIGYALTALVSHKCRTSNVQHSTSNSENLRYQTPPTPAHDRKVPRLCASHDQCRRQCILLPAFRLPELRQCAGRGFFQMRASDSPTS